MKLTDSVAAAALLLSATAAMAQTTPPSEVPQVTVTAATKLLIFDWQPVPGATYYQLYVNVDGHSGYTKTGPQIAAPGTRAGYGISVHLQHWQDALFRLSACNAAGCRDSKSLFPRRHMLETIGYFKASNTDGNDSFGFNLALSGDGSTMAVDAEGEASKATGINGDQSDNSLTDAGAVYVYRKVNGNWRQEAYIKPPENDFEHRVFGSAAQYGMQALGLTNDGNTLVVGDRLGDADSHGEVITYVRASNGGWSMQSRLSVPEAFAGDSGFGDTVDISADGQTLRVGLDNFPGSNGTAQGVTYLFVRSGSSWQLVQRLVVEHAGYDCAMSRLSGDASTLVQYCAKAHYQAAHVETYKRSGNTWSHASDLDQTASQRQQPALSSDGNALAIRLPVIRGDLFTYNVRVFRWSNSTWVAERTFASPAASDDSGFDDWGNAMSFNGNGSFLAIGDSAANVPGPAGVSEEATAGQVGTRGVVLLYQRTAGAAAPWNLRSQLLPPTTAAPNIRLGNSLALSATGATLAVAAFEESSKARGINGDQTDTSAPDAGAVFLY